MGNLAVIYARISSDPEGRAVGVERQVEDCLALAERHGYTVVGIYRDNDVSASTTSAKRRPGFDAMVAHVRHGEVAAVLAYSNSRLTRRVREYLDLIELHRATGVLFRTVVSGDADLSTADGRGVALTLATWDQAEAERTRERVLRAKADGKARGAYGGGPRPFGYEADGVTLRLDEARMVAEAADRLLDGATLGRLCRDWNAAGVTTTRGNPWAPNALRRTLTRPRNAALIEHAGDYLPASWPPLMTRERWEAVRALLGDPARRTNGGLREPRWLMSGIARCGAEGCGAAVRRTVSRGIASYRCPVASHTSRRQEQIDDLVRGVIAARLRRPDARDLLAGRTTGTDERPELRRTLAELDARLDALAADVGLSERMLAKRAAVLEAEAEAVRRRLDALNALAAASAPLAALAAARDPAAAFLAADLDTQRAVVAELVTVTFTPTGKRGRPAGWRPGQPYFDPESVAIRWRRRP